MLALDLVEPPGRLQQEPHLPVPLKLLLIFPQLLLLPLRAGAPRRKPSGPAAAWFVRRVHLAQCRALMAAAAHPLRVRSAGSGSRGPTGSTWTGLAAPAARVAGRR